MKTITVLLLLTFITGSYAQQLITVSGIIEEVNSKERLNSTTLLVLETKKYFTANEYGFFSFSTKANDSCTVILTHSGHSPLLIKIFAARDTFLLLKLYPQSKQLEEVIITANSGTIENKYLGAVSIPIKVIDRVPALMGEKDVIKAIQLLPGVQTGSEGSTGFYVRGGGADQNLILIDGVTVYNVSHLFGFLSLFPTESVKSVDFIKGGFPARYGGRLSSVLDIKLKEGSQAKYTGSYSIGLLSSKFSVEGPIKKGKSSFIVTGRRTYLDVLAKPFLAKNSTTGGYYFYDGIAKLNFTINTKNKLYISTYSGNDKFYIKTKDQTKTGQIVTTSTGRTNFGWGNFTAALRWNQIINKKVFFNHSFNYTRFKYNLNFLRTDREESGTQPNKDFAFKYYSSIADYTIKTEMDYFVNNSTKVKAGVSVTKHNFTPSSSSVRGVDSLQVPYSKTEYSKTSTRENTIFVEANHNYNSRITLLTGLHSNLYTVQGKNYFSVQPRLNGKYILNNSSALQLSYSYMMQPIHLLTNNGPGIPTDLWVPSTKNIQPQKAHQFSIGYNIPFNNTYELSIDAYYKTMNRVIEYTEASSFLNNSINWEDKVAVGKGTAYGTEFFLQKKLGSITGWVGYTLSWAKRNFNNINGGNTFFYKYDHRHDFKLVAIWDVRKNLEISFDFVLNSGNRITLPDYVYSGLQGAYPYDVDISGAFGYLDSYNNQYVYNFTSRNNASIRTYHRADISINYLKERKKGTRVWNISIYNLYSRQNAFFYYYRKKNGVPTLTQLSLFPLLPSISYQFKWK
jgi:outer membrane cobalamin receptor